jgi:hypothetical protein
MHNTPRLKCIREIVSVSMSLAALTGTSIAQTRPPDMPTDLLSGITGEYEQGIQKILAQDAARPKAVRPRVSTLPITAPALAAPEVIGKTSHDSPVASPR